jgi:hypothetical protein
MADKRVTDLDPIVTAPISGVMHFIDTTDATQNAAGSSFKVTKEDFLKENTAAILLNTAKVGISVAQAAEIEANNAKVGISTPQAGAIVLNTAKVGFTDALVASAPTVTANTAKVGITAGQSSAIVTNTAKISFDPTSSTRLANTSGTNTGDLLNSVSILAISPIIATSVWVGSQAQYDALVTKSGTVIYNIV